MHLADQIRQYVIQTWIEPARQRGERSVRLQAWQVHASMGLRNRLPAVCGALDAGKFEDQARVRRMARYGPAQGGKAEWLFEVEG